MIIERYDAERSPVAEEWLEEDPDHLMMLVEAFHNDAEEEFGDGGPRVHATMHVIVENQIAEDVPHVRDAVARLIRQGLTRHESVHAIAAILAEDIFHLMKGNIESFDSTKYSNRLRKITAKRWRKGKY